MIKSGIILCSIMATILCTQSIALGEEKFIFTTFPIPRMVIDENKGLFIDLTKTIAERGKLNIQIIFSSPKRALRDFIMGNTDVLFPAVRRKIPIGTEFIESSEAIFIKKSFIFSRKGEPLLSAIKDLENKRVGITTAFAYPEELLKNKLITIDEVSGDDLNALKLIKGRVDAFVVEEESGLAAFQNIGKSDAVQYNPERPVATETVFYAFQKNKKCEKLEKIVSSALSEIVNDGTFKKIMSQ